MKDVLVDMHRLKSNPYNGLYRFSKDLGMALARLHDPELRLHFYVPQTHFGIFGKDAFYLKHRSLHKFWQFSTQRFDIWHVTTTLSWYRPFNAKTKNIFTIHDLNFMTEAERSAAWKKRYLKLIQERVKRADFITYISEFSKQQALQYLDMGCVPSRVIHNGGTMPEHKNLLINPPYKPAKPFLFSIGMFVERKNFHVLPSLLAGNDYELLLAGFNDFDYKKKVLEAAAEAGVAHRVKLLGTISEEEKFWYYQHCEAFLFPSIGEGFGLPIIEAMWYGKPVFLSRETSLPEIGGDAAYYFDNFSPETMRRSFEAGMQHFYETKPQQKIIERASVFSWAKAAKEYMEVYKAV